jgi:Ni/Fe-hydrogenase subunit HybB-like protein
MSASTRTTSIDDPFVVEDPHHRRPPLDATLTHGETTHTIAAFPELPLAQTPRGFTLFFAFCATLGGSYLLSILYLLWEGTGIWGNNNPAGWAFPIVNLVFWVGIGHAGTLISAILFLFRQSWRTSINRYAEAMTIFAVIVAVMFPGIHVGRMWVAYFMFPVPNQMDMWPNFRSPLLMDLFAFSTYFTVSCLFWYTGLVPDLATLRDRATTKARRFIFGVLSLGWRGSMRHWHTYEKAYQIMACLSAPLVLSVHTIVSFDFAVAQLPGWHTTIFPPYFVAGAIFSGFAMVQTLMLPARRWLSLERIITLRHVENVNKIMLLTGSLVGYAYGMEIFIAWYSGNEYEWFTFVERVAGPYAWAYWIMVSMNVIIPQTFWFKRARTSIAWSFVASILVNIGMWFERFVITVSSTARDFLPSSWDYYVPTGWDLFMLAGSFGLFLTMFLAFVRFLPAVSMAEVKATVEHARHV